MKSKTKSKGHWGLLHVETDKEPQSQIKLFNKQAHISYEAKTARDLLVAIGPVGTFVAIGTFAAIGTLVAIGTFVAIGSFVAIGTYVAIGTFVAIRTLLSLELLLS